MSDDATTGTTAGADADVRRGRAPLLATVVAALPNERFQVRCEDGRECTAHVAGDLRKGFTRLVPGDTVRIEPSPFDPTKARILAALGARRR